MGSNLAPEVNVLLLRTIWRDECYDNGQVVVGKVFPKSDLEADRYISADRHDLLDEQQAHQRLEGQQDRQMAKGDTTGRVSPDVGFLLCSEVENLLSEKGGRIFSITDASEGFWPSHCAVTYVNPDPGKPGRNDARLLLMGIVLKHGIVPYVPEQK